MQHSIPCCLRKDNTSYKWNYAFAIGWRWLIPTTKNLIIFHDSILPKYRGFNPLVTALINGDTEIGVTALFASELADEGDIIDTSTIGIQYPIQIITAIESITGCYMRLALSIANKIRDEVQIVGYEQDSSIATYSLWRDESDYIIDWTQSADKIKRHIDASGSPYLGAKTSLNGINVRVLSADIISDLNIENRTPGKAFMIDNGVPIVVCGSGLLRLNDVRYNGDSILPITKLRSRFS